MPHVLLIDNDKELNGLHADFLCAQGFQATSVLTGEDGARLAANGNFDAIILDVLLPGMDGIEVLRRVRRRSFVPVIVLTAQYNDVDRVVGLEMGADDYVAKPVYPRELVARLKAVLRRRSSDIANPEPLEMLDLRLDPARREVTWDGRLFELTRREFNMLESLLRAADTVVTKDVLSSTVLGRKREVYDRSVEAHVGNLRRKISAACEGELEIETVRGVGFRLRPRKERYSRLSENRSGLLK